MPGFPKTLVEFLGFTAAVFLASVAINMITARIPQAAALQKGL